MKYGRSFVLRALSVVAIGATLALAGGTAHAGQRQADVNLKGVKCPVCNMQAREQFSADYKGAKVYFGCGGCPPVFQAQTKKFATKANLQLVATQQARQKACPIMGGKPQKNLKMTVGGVTVYFCCPGCPKSLAKLSPEGQVEKVFNDQTFAKAFEIPKKK